MAVQVGVALEARSVTEVLAASRLRPVGEGEAVAATGAGLTVLIPISAPTEVLAAIMQVEREVAREASVITRRDLPEPTVAVAVAVATASTEVLGVRVSSGIRATVRAAEVVEVQMQIAQIREAVRELCMVAAVAAAEISATMVRPGHKESS